MVTRIASLALLALLPLGAQAIEAEQLHGTWQLVSMTQKIIATGEVIEPLGPGARGFLSYGADGRMSAILVGGDRPKNADMAQASADDKLVLFGTMIAYAGTYAVEGDTVTHEIDISWNESWTGTKQLRIIRIEGDKLLLATNPQPSGIDGRMMAGELVWQRVKPGKP